MNILRVISNPLPAVFATLLLLSCSVAAQETPSSEPVVEQNTPSSESLLPPNTRAWISIPDADALGEAIEGTQFGAMMNDPDVKPFIDDLANQFRSYLNEQNIRFGMKVSDIEEVQSGEICLAGILKQAAEGVAEAAPEHAVLLLVDVSETKQKATELLEKVGEELSSREATEEEFEVCGITGSKWSFKEPQGVGQKQFAFHALVGPWLVACDNESTFRDIVSRIVEPNEGAPTISENEAFLKIGEKCQFSEEGYSSHVRWFIEPFGYVQLAQAIADTRNPNQRHNHYAEKFREEGFSAILGLGGVLSVHTDEHEAVHRTFVYAPPVGEGEDRYKRAAAMLDFRNEGNNGLEPPVWVPQDSAGYLTFTWNLRKALDNVGYIIDKTSGTEGSFDRALNSLRDDLQGPRVDMREFVSCLNDRITVCTVTQLSGDTESTESERIVFGIRIRSEVESVEDPESYIADAIERLVQNDAKVFEHHGTRILLVDTAEEELEFDMEPEFDEFADPLADVEDEEEFKQPKPLFEQRVFVVRNGYLLIGNNLDQMMNLLDNIDRSPGKELGQARDYVRVQDSLKKLSGGNAPSFRHFGRMDQTLRANYEMMRTGHMAQSKTVLAQLLNRAYTTDDQPDGFERQQKIDGSKMPEDYDTHVAPYFGPTGLVVHTEPEGWMITGCILKKTPAELNTAKSVKDELVSENK